MKTLLATFEDQAGVLWDFMEKEGIPPEQVCVLTTTEAEAKGYLAELEEVLGVKPQTLTVPKDNYQKTWHTVTEWLDQQKQEVVVLATAGTFFMRLGLTYAAHQRGLKVWSHYKGSGSSYLVSMAPLPRE